MAFFRTEPCLPIQKTKTFNDPKNKEYRSIIESRVLDYADNLVLKDGVDAEHSPSYHVNVASVLDTISIGFADIDPAFSQNLLNNYINKMTDYAIYITRPDGSYPPLGDSGTSFVKFEGWDSNPYYEYVETAGKSGTMPDALDRVYPYGNYAIFRTNWKMDGSADWLMFTAATHGGSHKHQDDLSFLIWHHGDLFVDAGSAGYDYTGDPMALYGVQPWGHNVMVSNWDIFANKKIYTYRPDPTADALKTKITDSHIGSPQVFVTGTQQRMPGVKQTRRLDWDKTAGLITIKDDVTSSKTTNKFLFLYHLADDIKPVMQSGGIALYRGEKEEAVISFKSLQKSSIRLCYGDEDELVKAWDAAKRVPNWIIAVEFDGAPPKMSLNTSIQLLN